MMGLDVQPREARKPLEVALDGPAGAALRAAPGGDAEDEETRKAAEVTAQVLTCSRCFVKSCHLEDAVHARYVSSLY